MSVAALRAGPVAGLIREQRLIAILRRVEPRQRLTALVDELAGAGVRVFEVTFDSPDADHDVAALRARLAGRSDGPFLVGAGTLLRRPDLEAARRAGADFGVAPVLDPTMVDIAVREGLPFVPGAFTPTEVAAAWAAGATFVKLFPAAAVGPSFVRELRGPMPEVQLLPTGGVDSSNIRAFLDAGATAVGVGGALLRADAAGRRELVARGGRAGPMSAKRHGRFAGRVVVVTGSTGMAASAARGIAAEGGAVFVVSRDPRHAEALATRIERDGGRSGWHAADLRREDAVEAAFEALDRALGRLDGLFSAAGISGRRLGDGPLHEATLDGWEGVMAANATSQFLVCRAAARRMLRQDPDAGGQRGVLLTMSSALATHPAPEHFATHAYAASKGAVEALTRALAAYYAPHRIRVNAIAPALVATPMSRRAQEDPAVLAYLARRQPLAGGPIEADAVTAAALFLLSDEARMITGQVVSVDGGWTVSEGGPVSAL